MWRFYPINDTLLFHFNPRYELFLIIRTDLLAFCEILIESLKPLEFSEHGLIELIDTLERLLSDGLLVVSEEEAPEVFIKEEVTRVERRLRLGQLVQVLRDLVGLWVVELQEEVTVWSRVLAREREEVQSVGLVRVAVGFSCLSGMLSCWILIEAHWLILLMILCGWIILGAIFYRLFILIIILSHQSLLK
jgi:hypothetical protein